MSNVDNGQTAEKQNSSYKNVMFETREKSNQKGKEIMNMNGFIIGIYSFLIGVQSIQEIIGQKHLNWQSQFRKGTIADRRIGYGRKMTKK